VHQALARVNVPVFVAELRAIGDAEQARSGPDDLVHLTKMQRWGRLCTLVGYATAWLGPNPLAWLAISQGNVTRWMIMHHVGHGAYDRLAADGAPWHSARFARGWRRWWQWPDWMVPEAWNYEHNRLHHYQLNEAHDPDFVQRNVALLRASRLPRPLKLAVALAAALTWKWLYYAPSTLAAVAHRREAVRARRGDGSRHARRTPLGGDPASEVQARGGAEGALGRAYALHHFRRFTRADVWLRSLLPYAFYRWGVMPALFLPLGTTAWAWVLVNSLLAELVTNLHTFLVIVPNHVGDDLPAFTDPAGDHDEHLVRQVVASVNFRTGGDLNDWAHMWLNYQIEHHIWPRMTMLGQQRVQPAVRALCEAHGVPYVQQGVGWRVWETLRVVMGDGTHPVWTGNLQGEPGAMS
jgi:fatty acid desaturase